MRKNPWFGCLRGDEVWPHDVNTCRAEVKQLPAPARLQDTTLQSASESETSTRGFAVFKSNRMTIIQLLTTDRSFSHVAKGERSLAKNSDCCELRPRLGRIKRLGSPKKLDQPPGLARSWYELRLDQSGPAPCPLASLARQGGLWGCHECPKRRVRH